MDLSHHRHVAPWPAPRNRRTHLKKQEAASDFARNKTITQQRRSLPVYGVRDDLLQVQCSDARRPHALVACAATKATVPTPVLLLHSIVASTSIPCPGILVAQAVVWS